MSEFRFESERSVGAADFSSPAEALVGLIMGSDSDYPPAMEACAQQLDKLGILFEMTVPSAHRTPLRMIAYAQAARHRGLKVIIACAGGSSHLPGMVGALTTLPVLAVAPNKLEKDIAAPLSSVRMPKGAPLGFIGFEQAGAVNAALFAARIVGAFDENIARLLEEFERNQANSVPPHPYLGEKK